MHTYLQIALMEINNSNPERRVDMIFLLKIVAEIESDIGIWYTICPF